MAEWCTIESDPGVFTELIKNIGVKGVEVEEILDMDTLGSDYEEVYGLIFLFKYIKNSGYTPNVLSKWDDDLFFAKQVIENACATQAILGILMNNSEKIDIGETLKELKTFTSGMDPNMKGLSISNSEKIKTEHNKFSRPEPFVFTKTVAKDGDDVFHFVSYIHFKNNIYEIDGLREGPILIKENVENKDWIKELKPAIIDRINLYTNNEIKFNLLAVVPNRLDNLLNLKKELEEKQIYIENVIKGGDMDLNNQKFSEYNSMSKENLENCLKEIKNQILNNNDLILNEEEKIKKYKEENERRQHNYIPLIFEILKIMGENGTLEETYENAKKLEEEKAKKKEEEKKNK
jgi:ubiquitin carboxyl-terminal hydrolase L5